MTEPLTTKEVIDVLQKLPPDAYLIEPSVGTTWISFTYERMEAIVNLTNKVHNIDFNSNS